jgi:hypothetical protein
MSIDGMLENYKGKYIEIDMSYTSFEVEDDYWVKRKYYIAPVTDGFIAIYSDPCRSIRMGHNSTIQDILSLDSKVMKVVEIDVMRFFGLDDLPEGAWLHNCDLHIDVEKAYISFDMRSKDNVSMGSMEYFLNKRPDNSLYLRTNGADSIGTNVESLQWHASCAVKINMFLKQLEEYFYRIR